MPPSCNPVSRLYRKPSARRDRKESQRAEYLEIPDAAKALEAARKLNHTRRNGLIEFVHPLVATFLLTGGRKAEVLGLTWGDIDFDLGLVTFAPNQRRGLKRVWSERSVPLWPQLREILEAYRRAGCSPSDLLFPSPRTAHGGREGMVNDLRKAMAELRKQSSVNLPEGVTIFRHTYATARLQTTDNGKQIAIWTVAKELGVCAAEAQAAGQDGSGVCGDVADWGHDGLGRGVADESGWLGGRREGRAGVPRSFHRRDGVGHGALRRPGGCAAA